MSIAGFGLTLDELVSDCMSGSSLKLRTEPTRLSGWIDYDIESLLARIDNTSIDLVVLAKLHLYLHIREAVAVTLKDKPTTGG
jgi:hypothetical protein